MAASIIGFSKGKLVAVVLFDQTYLVALAEANHMLGNTGNGSIVPIGQVKQWGGGGLHRLSQQVLACIVVTKVLQR